jgi:hypothetical protein
MQTVAEKLALSILTRHGVAAIWKLNEAAADAHRTGHPRSAAVMLELGRRSRGGMDGSARVFDGTSGSRDRRHREVISDMSMAYSIIETRPAKRYRARAMRRQIALIAMTLISGLGLLLGGG